MHCTGEFEDCQGVRGSEAETCAHANGDESSRGTAFSDETAPATASGPPQDIIRSAQDVGARRRRNHPLAPTSRSRPPRLPSGGVQVVSVVQFAAESCPDLANSLCKWNELGKAPSERGGVSSQTHHGHPLLFREFFPNGKHIECHTISRQRYHQTQRQD